MATKICAETFEQFQHAMWINHENLRYIVHILQLRTNPNLQHVLVSEEGVTKTFTCARTLIGQHVFLQLVGVEGSLSVCEVEVFTTDGRDPRYPYVL
jgi:hypothetical protein